MALIKYSIGVKTPAGWRQVDVVAVAKVSRTGKMAEVLEVLTIDGEKPSRDQSRTGAKRQAFNGGFFAVREVGAKKRVSAVEMVKL